MADAITDVLMKMAGNAFLACSCVGSILALVLFLIHYITIHQNNGKYQIVPRGITLNRTFHD